MSSSGLTRRRGAGGGGAANTEGEGSNAAPKSNSSNNVRDSGPETSYENSENGHKIAFDPRDISESAERSKQPKLTMMEEVLLLGLKDKQVRLHTRVIATRRQFQSSSSKSLALVPPTNPRWHLGFLQGTRAFSLTCCAESRVTCPSGMTTSPMPSEDASSSNWPSAAVSAWKRTPRDGDFPRPTET